MRVDFPVDVAVGVGVTVGEGVDASVDVVTMGGGSGVEVGLVLCRTITGCEYSGE